MLKLGTISIESRTHSIELRTRENLGIYSMVSNYPQVQIETLEFMIYLKAQLSLEKDWLERQELELRSLPSSKTYNPLDLSPKPVSRKLLRISSSELMIQDLKSFSEFKVNMTCCITDSEEHLVFGKVNWKILGVSSQQLESKSIETSQNFSKIAESML